MLLYSRYYQISLYQWKGYWQEWKIFPKRRFSCRFLHTASWKKVSCCATSNCRHNCSFPPQCKLCFSIHFTSPCGLYCQTNVFPGIPTPDNVCSTRSQEGERSESGEAAGSEALDVFRYQAMLFFWYQTDPCPIWLENLSCFVFHRTAASPRLQIVYSAMVLIAFTTGQERKWNMHVFTEPKPQAKMDDNSSMVALRHISDSHIMRKCFSFPLLLFDCLNAKFVFV